MVRDTVGYRARWLFAGDGEVIENAVVEVDAGGRIASISEGEGRDAVDLGHVAIVPALVNAHVHLEFSDLARPVGPPRPFPAWIERVVNVRRSRAGSIGDVIGKGISELRRGGTVGAGEIATCDLDVYEQYAEPLSLCLFREMIGPQSANWAELLAIAESHLELCAATPHISGGLSPHAPYTVPQELFERAVSLAKRHDAAVAVHLAETESERMLLESGQGELVEMMRSLGLWDEALHPGTRGFADWIELLAECRRGLVIHGNYLKDEELERIAGRENLTLVYCPRTHAYFGHAPHPFSRLLEMGGRVALGTDGRSSNPDLSLWAEASFVAWRNPGLASDRILEMVTRAGAEALGISDRAGVLAVGREANFLAVNVEEVAGRPVLFRSGREPLRVFHRGVEISDREPA